MDYATESLKLHEQLRGKIEIVSRAKVDSKEALSLAYTPGVAQPCLEIQKDISKSYDLTRRWNTVAVVTDGTAVLGLGDIGPEAGMPVMEGKCVLFKEFGGVDAVSYTHLNAAATGIAIRGHVVPGTLGGKSHVVNHLSHVVHFHGDESPDIRIHIVQLFKSFVREGPQNFRAEQADFFSAFAQLIHYVNAYAGGQADVYKRQLRG